MNLQVVSDDGDEQLQQVIHGRDYKLRAFFSRPDGKREFEKYLKKDWRALQSLAAVMWIYTQFIL